MHNDRPRGCEPNHVIHNFDASNVGCGMSENLANAAPDLYEAVNLAMPEIQMEIVSLVESYSIGGDTSTIDKQAMEEIERLKAIVEKMEAATTKARGLGK